MTGNNRDRVTSTFKSKDTEEWLDIWFTRPLGYWWAVQCNRLGLHPNAVTVISIILGAFAGYCFQFVSLGWNLLGIAMLVWANLLDSADGQLARMTGKKTMLGRILDGFAGDVWFFCIYFFLGIRLTPQPMPFGIGCNWGVWIWLLMAFSGFVCHKAQASLADYYRNIYLYYQSGNSELSSSAGIKAERNALSWRTDWFYKIALFFYVRYTSSQERSTPQFQRMRAAIDSRYGKDIPQEIRTELCRRMFPLLKWTNISTFNTRAIVLYITLLCNQPWLYFIFEITVMNIIYFYMRGRHERICRDMADSLLK